jgi:hypothetical protein
MQQKRNLGKVGDARDHTESFCLPHLTELGKGSDSKDTSTSIFNEITGLLVADNYRDFLIPVLLEVGFLVPTSKK